MLKLDDNPPMLSPNAHTVAGLDGRWWVGRTRSRLEKVFAWDLLRRGVGYFLPMVERRRVWGARRRCVMIPLFPSYVFFCGGEDARLVALTTNCLVQTLDVANERQLVGELCAIETVLAAGITMDAYPTAAVGSRCRVTGGPLQGLEGTLVEQQRCRRMVLSVGLFGQGAVLDIGGDLLELVDDGGTGERLFGTSC